LRRAAWAVAAAPGAAALLVASFLALGTAVARGPLDDTPVWLVANRELTVSTPAGSGVLRLYLSEDWNQPQPAITRAIVTIHGVLRDADIARTVAEVGRAASGLDPESVLLVEPQFLDDIDVAAEHLPAETLRWDHFGWEAGDDAHGPAPISSFAALDGFWPGWRTALHSRRSRQSSSPVTPAAASSCSAMRSPAAAKTL
jgi:hypothetical protein